MEEFELQYATLKREDLQGKTLREWCKDKCLEKGMTEELKGNKSWEECFEFLYQDNSKTVGNPILDVKNGRVWTVTSASIYDNELYGLKKATYIGDNILTFSSFNLIEDSKLSNLTEFQKLDYLVKDSFPDLTKVIINKK